MEFSAGLFYVKAVRRWGILKRAIRSVFNRRAHLASFAQRLEEPSAVLIIHKDSFAPIPSAHHVVDRSWILHPQLPCHSEKLPLCRTTRQYKYRILRD